MRKFLGLKTAERAGAGPQTGSPPERPAQPDGDDLLFLPPSRAAASTGATGQPRRAPRAEEEAVPMPGANKSRLAGLFAGDGDDLFGSAGSTGSSRSVPAEAVSRTEAAPVQAAQQATQTQMLWSGSGSLYRLDDDGSAMVEVDAGESRGSLHGAAVKMLPAAADEKSTIDLIVYTAMRKRSRMKTPVQNLDLQAPNDESVCFYDEHGIYWALQLDKAAEALRLTRVLLAAKALLTGQLQALEMRVGVSEEVIGPVDVVGLRAAACLRDLASEGAEELVVEASSEIDLRLTHVETRWGAGVADYIVGLCQGASTLLAVPPRLQAAPLFSGGKTVLLLDLADVRQGRSRADSASASASPQKDRTSSFASQDSDAIPSVKERMAKLGISTLPAIAAAGSASPSAVGSTAAAPVAESHNLNSPAAEAFAASQLPMTGSPATEALPPAAGLLAAVSTPAPLPGAAGFPNSGAPTFPAPAFTAPGAFSGMTSVHHPVADIMRQFWSAVQEGGAGSPYAYLGALPFVPGLTLPPSRPLQQMTQAPAPAPATVAPTPATVAPAPATVPAPPVATFSSVQSDLQSMESIRSSDLARAASAPVNMPLRTTPLSSVALGDLVEAIREVVRKEATPEGWQVERQKLERRVALLEEQLNAAKAHQEQVRETNRSQLTAMQRQLAESQLLAQQMREQQLRNETDRQMRDWERDAARGSLEAELQQHRSELQQLRLEERSLRDRLADAEIGKQRAEGAAASAAGVAAALPGLEARLQEQTSVAATAQRDLQTVTAQIQVLVSARPADAMALCKNAMSIAYVGAKQAIPGSGACVDADAVRGCLREVCKQSCLALERQLQQVPVDASLALSEQLDWDAVEKLALASLGPPLQDLGAGMEAAVERATASAAEAVEKATAEAARSAAEVKAAAAAQAAAEAAAKNAAEELAAATQKASLRRMEEKLAAEVAARRAAKDRIEAEEIAVAEAAAAAAQHAAQQIQSAQGQRQEPQQNQNPNEQMRSKMAARKAKLEGVAEWQDGLPLPGEQEAAEKTQFDANTVAVDAFESFRAEECAATEHQIGEDESYEIVAEKGVVEALAHESAEVASRVDEQKAVIEADAEQVPEEKADVEAAIADQAAVAEQAAAEEAAQAATDEFARTAAEAAAQKAAEEVARSAEEEALRRAAEQDEAACRAAEQEASQRAAEEEAAQKAAQAEEAQRAADEEAAQKAAQAEEAQRAADEEAAQKAAQAEEAQRAAEEAARRVAEEHAAEEVQRAAEEAARRVAEEHAAEEAQRAAEEAARRLAEERAAEEAQRAAEEAARKVAEERAVEEAKAEAAAAESKAAAEAAVDNHFSSLDNHFDVPVAQSISQHTDNFDVPVAKSISSLMDGDNSFDAEEDELPVRDVEKAAVPAVRPPSAKQGASLFGDDDDDDDEGIFGMPARGPRPAVAATNGGAASKAASKAGSTTDLFGEGGGAAVGRGAGGPRKPPKSLFGDDSDTDGSFVLSK